MQTEGVNGNNNSADVTYFGEQLENSRCHNDPMFRFKRPQAAKISFSVPLGFFITQSPNIQREFCKTGLAFQSVVL